MILSPPQPTVVTAAPFKILEAVSIPHRQSIKGSEVDPAVVGGDTELSDVPSQVSPLPPLLDQVLSIQGMNSGQKQVDINPVPRGQGLIN